MTKGTFKEGFIIELPKEAVKRISLKEGDWLVVKLLSGKEVVLEKPKEDYWEETFAWGREFAKEKKIRAKNVARAIREVRSAR